MVLAGHILCSPGGVELREHRISRISDLANLSILQSSSYAMDVGCGSNSASSSMCSFAVKRHLSHLALA